jgi:hypothetical protein
MLRRLPNSLLLILLLFALLYTSPAWAESNGEESGNVSVRVSPLTLLVQNEVTIKVGEFTCLLVNGIDPSSVCSDLPPGEYEVSASAEGYIVSPSSYQLTIPDNAQDSEDADEESDDSSGAGDEDSDYYFWLYQIHNRLYVPNVQVER